MIKSTVVVAMTSIALGAMSLAGCASSDPSDEEASQQQTAEEFCTQDDRGETYSSGMSHTGDHGIAVELQDSSPAPPALYDNEWTLLITDADGAPIEDATVDVLPEMPDHGHGTNREAVVTWVDGAEYQVSPVNFMMTGYWEVTVDVKTQEGSDSVVFKFCIDG